MTAYKNMVGAPDRPS